MNCRRNVLSHQFIPVTNSSGKKNSKFPTSSALCFSQEVAIFLVKNKGLIQVWKIFKKDFYKSILTSLICKSYCFRSE